MAEFLYTLPNGKQIITEQPMSQIEATQLAANAGVISGEEAFPQRDINAAASQAQQKVFDDLPAAIKAVVGFRGATRSLAAGINPGAADSADFESRERGPIDIARGELGFSTLGELVPNFAARGKVLAQAGQEGLIEGLKAPAGEKISSSGAELSMMLVWTWTLVLALEETAAK